MSVKFIALKIHPRNLIITNFPTSVIRSLEREDSFNNVMELKQKKVEITVPYLLVTYRHTDVLRGR